MVKAPKDKVGASPLKSLNSNDDFIYYVSWAFVILVF